MVDDDRLVRKGIISAMPWRDFDMEVVGEAANGTKALEFLESHEVDLLLTDLAMPVMTGIELMREVRERYPHIHIVILTMHQDFEYIQEALRLGAIDYIAKVQLEQEKFDKVLERIASRIRTSQPTVKDREIAKVTDENGSFYNDVSEETLNQWKKALKSFEWIQNEALFRTILEEWNAVRLPQTKWVTLLAEWVYDWNRVFESDKSMIIKLPANGEEIGQWLTRIRQDIRDHIRKRNVSPEVGAAVMKAIDFMQNELNQQVTAADIASRVGISRSYFSQCFKDIVGITFNDYLRKIRIEKAKTYLIGTGKTVQWIAENTGYMDERYFSRIFRDQTGSLPSEFRKSFRDGGSR
nr:response regulator [Cohnella endophytica]